jgi:hypothetical protein
MYLHEHAKSNVTSAEIEGDVGDELAPQAAPSSLSHTLQGPLFVMTEIGLRGLPPVEVLDFFF